MNILCVVVTHNREDYSRRCIESLRATVDEHFKLVVVDNASTDGTSQLADIRNTRNVFPGAACNIGWHHGLKTFDADLLMRSDNDIEYLPGWQQEVTAAFAAHPKLGQLGVLNMHEDFDGNQPVVPYTENDVTINVHTPRVGGNCLIRREIWDAGFRWAPGAWQPGGNDEDTQASQWMVQNKWAVARVVPTVANNMSFHRYDDYPDYYNVTAGLRGLAPQLSV